MRLSVFVAGADGYPAGWVLFKVEASSLTTSVEVVKLLPSLLRKRPPDFACLGIDIPIGLLDGSRRCDIEARKLLGWPRRNSAFPGPCRAALRANGHEEGSAINREATGSGLSRQAWGIARKIKQVDDTITAECQQWAFEVHPEVCFWALNGQRPLAHKKKRKEGVTERLALLSPIFPEIHRHLESRSHNVGKDDLLDAAGGGLDCTSAAQRSGDLRLHARARREGAGSRNLLLAAPSPLSRLPNS